MGDPLAASTPASWSVTGRAWCSRGRARGRGPPRDGRSCRRSTSLAAYQRDSARVEKRGPSMTTRVPPSTGSQPADRRGRDGRRAAGGAVGVGEGDVDRALRRSRSARGRWCGRRAGRAARACAGAELGASAPTAHGREDLADAEGAQRPQVGAVGMRCGGKRWSRPCRGRNATRRSPTSPTVIGPWAGRTGVVSRSLGILEQGVEALNRR